MRLPALCLPLLFLALACGGCSRKRETSTNPLLITPALAVEALTGKTIYYNGPALSWLQQQRPELLTLEEQQPMASRSKAFFQAAQDPRLFRQLDRQLHFDALLLCGDASQYHPLLQHLLDTRDWQLTYLDHTSLIFRRAPQPAWEPARLAAVQARLPGLRPAEEALWCALTASKLTSVRLLPAAREWLEKAQAHDRRVPEVWSSWGQYHLAAGEYQQALQAADEALKLEGGFPPALAVKTRAFYAGKHFAEAFRLSSQLLQARPEDPGLLFDHARIAHEVKEYVEEIRAMQKLVRLAEKAGVRADPGYHLYLAQAYLGDGQPNPALLELALALQDPNLPAEQRQFAEEARTQILQKTRGK